MVVHLSCFTVMTEIAAPAAPVSCVDSSFQRVMLQSPLCRPADSGVSSDGGSNDGDHVTEIADVALDLALSSSDEEPDVNDADSTPAAPRTKFSKERPTPRQLIVSWPLEDVQDVVSSTTPTSLSSAGMASQHSTDSPSSSTAEKVAAVTPSTCGRCTGQHYGKHTASCVDRGRFKSFATCTRCQCISVTKKQWRFHVAKCQASRRKDTEAPQHSWDANVTHTVTPIVQHICNHCDLWRTVHVRMLHLHKVLCSVNTDCYLPVLPVANKMNADTEEGELQFSYSFADTLMYAFKIKPILAAFESTGYIHDLVTRILAKHQVGGAAPMVPRAVTSDMDMTALPPTTTPPVAPPPCKVLRQEATFTQGRRRNPASKRLRLSSSIDLPSNRASQAPVVVRNGELSATHSGKPLNAAALEHCVKPSTEVHRGRKREQLVDILHQKADQHGVPRRWCEPQDLPAKLAEIHQHSTDVTQSQTSATPADRVHRDRFKILRRTGLWTDAYSRPTSPPATVKARLPKPEITFRGHLTANLMFCKPAEVTVSGHLPTGPGYFVLPDPTLANDAYKTAPGDDTPLPPLVASMPYLVHLYFADSTSDIAGMLMTNVELSKYRRLEYRAAGITSLVRITPLVAAPDGPDAP